ncbi:44564_t:CDS:2 [Gigaspora margarita]|uniref:Nitrate reductase [NADPH] n=1 Tax=Gigaspora margarita TaxID=4874 RepID=A0ABM8W2T4_GIGMA|nr:44564_t:CDS:2 [Gigaspora margarita]
MATNITNTNSIDPRDVGTPDDWIPRHPEMVRLTGKHPFNAESPLSLLMDQGFITPNPLHYVRNHGPVPKLHWDTHRLIVDGLVSKPLNLSMNDIEKFPYKEFPVTLVCAGNRRKELNMIKQSKGFNWGSAAVSCAIWKSVPLNYILKLAGINLDDCINDPRYICFIGADKLPNDYYGTSIPLEWCLNDINDVILAYEMNGERLPPDHGYPLRVIIPGCIGGRMVKWLSRITISNEESDSYYHYHDNRYAYTGGGNKITRVEISLDDGKTWILAKLNQPELDHPVVLKRGINPIPRYWCWSFWSLTISFYSFIRCEEISVRAWDATQNTQPRNPTWNVMGMMNNSHFRVKINTIVQGSEFRLIFEHPTQPGNLSGGWMVKSEILSPKLLTFSKNSTNNNEKIPTFNINDVAKHNNEKDCWIIIDQKVYDCTKFLKNHPGGISAILINAGKDVTNEFNDIHSTKARDLLKNFYIGNLVVSHKAKM